jgi:4-amino-4-deoxy-L-arabinose transferase-like glycosyltransferase
VAGAAELGTAAAPRVVVRRLADAYASRVGLISALGLAGRLAFLGYQPLWRDEAFTAVVVRKPLGAMLDAVRGDSAPPLAYVLDHLIARVWSSPAGLRLLSAVAGAAAIPVAAALGRRIAGNRGGVAAALVIAVTPAMVLAARDARMYALATTLVMASSLLLWRAVEKPVPSRFIAYAGMTALALYADYFAVLGVAAQMLALVVLRVRGRALAIAFLSALAAGITLVPWVLAARAQLGHAGAAFWVPPIGLMSVGGEFVQFFSGPPVEPWVPGKPLVQTLQGVAVAAGVLAGFALWRWRRRLPSSGRRTASFCLWCGAGGVLLLLALSAWRPLVDGRYASVVWGVLFVLVAAGLVVAGSRRAAGLGIALMASASIALSAAPTHPDTQAAVAALEHTVGPDDLVAAHPSQYLLLLYYAGPSVLSRTHVVAEDVPWFWGTAAYPPGAVIGSVPRSVTASSGNIYYVFTPADPGFGIPSRYRSESTRCWTGVCIQTFRRG